MTDDIEMIHPSLVFPWPQAGGAYRADPLTGELTRVESPDPAPTESAQE